MRRLAATCHFAAVLIALVSLVGASPLQAAEGDDTHHIERIDWSFAGFGGQYDRAQLQRGFQVYQQICAACHSLKRVRFRNLADKGGPAFPVESVKALAASWPYTVAGELDNEGKMVERLPTLSDPIVGPYKNDKEARAIQNGALPPDLSLVTNARGAANHAPWYIHIPKMVWDIATGYQEGGADYLVALMTSYGSAPVGVQLSDGLYYNTAFPGHQLAMPPPLAKDNYIAYQEDAGATGSFEQNVRDVTAFLAWVGNPNLNARKELGWQVLFYLLITTVLLYLVKKRIWARVKHES